MKKLRNALKNPEVYRFLTVLVFTCFIILLNWIIIFKVGEQERFLKKFTLASKKTLTQRFLNGFLPVDVFIREIKRSPGDFLLNILVFLPFGIFLPTLTKKRTLFKFLLTCLLTSVFFEVFQLITMWGVFDAGDLLANTLGFVVGYVFYILIASKMKKYTLAIIYFIILLIAIPISIYAVTTTALNFEFYISLLKQLPQIY